MAETVQGLLDDLLNEWQFDATQAQLLRDLNRRWGAMLTAADSYRTQSSFGTTVNGTAFYALPAGVVKVHDLSVAGVPYDRARQRDAYDYSQGRLQWYPSDVGLAFRDWSSAAVDGITLMPTPTTAGQAIAGLCTVIPPDLTADAGGNTLLTTNLEQDLYGHLLSGVAAERYRREGRWDLVTPAETDFGAGVERLRRRVAGRLRNAGPTIIRLSR